jgi:hypothetical protein
VLRRARSRTQPSRLGEVYRLWRLRCWGAFGPDQMHDEYEISALCTIIEALTPALGDASV